MTSVSDCSPTHLTTSERACDQLLAWVDRHRVKLLVGLLALYVLGFNGHWRAEPDSALYLNLGRNLATGNGYTYLGQPHKLAYPGLPMMLAGFFKAFGIHNLLPAHIAMFSIGLATLGLVYRLFWLHTGRPTAVLITLLVGLTRMFYRYCFQIMTDMPFLLGIMMFLVGYEAICISYGVRARNSITNEPRSVPTYRARWYDWALMPLGLAIVIVMRPTWWAFVPAVILATGLVIFRRQSMLTHRRIGWGIGVAAIVLMLVAAFFWFDPRQLAHEEGQPIAYEQVVFTQFTRDLPLHMKQVLANVRKIFSEITVDSILGIEFGYGVDNVLALAILLCGLLLIRERELWGIWIAAMIALSALVIAVDRYFLAVLPLMIYGLWNALRWVNHRLPGKYANWVFWILLAHVTLPNFVRVVDTMIEQRHSGFLKHYKSGRYLPMYKMAREIDAKLESPVLVIAPSKQGRIMTWYTKRWVIELADPFPIEHFQGKIYVLMDPDDATMKSQLDKRHIQLKEPIASVDRRKGPPLQLFSAERIDGASQ
jgi:hypothetical protein